MLSQANHTKELLERIEILMLATSLEDVDGILDCTYEGLYKLVPRREVKSRMKEVFKLHSFKNMIIGKDVIAVSDIFEIDKMQFSKIEYSLHVRLDREEDMLQRIIAEETINDEKYEHNRKKTVKFMLNVLKDRYGDDNVEYDKKADAYFITILSTMLAIKSGASHDWKFIKWMNGTVYKRIFPEGIVKKLATRFYLMD